MSVIKTECNCIKETLPEHLCVFITVKIYVNVFY